MYDNFETDLCAAKISRFDPVQKQKCLCHEKKERLFFGPTYHISQDLLRHTARHLTTLKQIQMKPFKMFILLQKYQSS